MAEKLTYVRVNWEDSPSENTPINSENLNKMDVAIEAVVNLANRHSEQIDGLGGGSGGGLEYGIYVGDTQPTNGVMYWLDTSGDSGVDFEPEAPDTPVEPDVPDEPEESQTEPVYTLASAVTFDGTEAVAPVDTGYKLHDEDKDWSIVCDFSGKPDYQIPVWNAVDSNVGFGAALYSKSGWAWYVCLAGGTYADNGIGVGTGNATNKKVVVTHNEGVDGLTAYYVSDSTMASEEGSCDYSRAIGSPATVEIGGESDVADKHFNGTVHDLKIYERVLSETEIKEYLGVE